MDFLLHFTPSTYTNLKADLIARNKIDGVSFELNDIIEAFGEQYKGDVNIYKDQSSQVALDDNVAQKNFSTDAEAINHIKNEFKAKKDVRVVNTAGGVTTLFIAMEIKTKERLIHNPQFKALIEKTKKMGSNDIEEGRYNLCAVVPGIQFDADMLNIQIVNDSKIYIFFRTNITNIDASQYTKKLAILIEADGWSKLKKNVSYVLGSNGNLVEVVENENGTLSRKMDFPFKYPSNDFLQYNITYEMPGGQIDLYVGKTDGLWHKYIALDLLNNYKYGRRTVSFEVPETEFSYCSIRGDLLDKNNNPLPKDTNGKPIGVPKTTDITGLKIGTRFLISEREWTDDKKTKFAGGSYRETLIYKQGETPPIDLPRQYQITNLEYKYNGSFTVSIKALEIPYALADKA